VASWDKVKTYVYGRGTAKRQAKGDVRNLGHAVLSQFQLLPWVKEVGWLHQTVIYQVAQVWEDVKGSLYAKLETAMYDLKQAVTGMESLEGQKEEILKRLDKWKAKARGLSLIEKISIRFYWLLMALFATGEGAFNFVVFNLMGDSLPLILPIAITVGVCFPLASDQLGKYLHPEPGKGKNVLRRWLLVLGLVAFPFMAMLAVSMLRGVYYGWVFSDAGEMPPISTGAIAPIYLIFNLLVYGLATVLSYSAHRPEVISIRREGKELTKEAKSLERLLKIGYEKVRSAKARIDQLSAQFGSAFEYYKLEAEKVRFGAYHLIEIYYKYLLRRLKGSCIPACIKHYPEIEIPVELQNMDYGLEKLRSLISNQIIGEIHYAKNTNGNFSDSPGHTAGMVGDPSSGRVKKAGRLRPIGHLR